MFLQLEILQVKNFLLLLVSVLNVSFSVISQSLVYNRTDEEKVAEVISDDVIDEDKVEVEQREEVQKKVLVRIFLGYGKKIFK